MAGLVIALVVIFTAGGTTKDAESGSDASVRKAMTAAGCTFVSKAPLPPKPDFRQLPPGRADAHDQGQMEHVPPSGGSHYPLWAVWGFYTQPVNPRQVVHNLEHGGVVLWWGPDVPGSTISELRSFYNASPTGMFGTPIAGLGNKVAISAWTGDPARYYRNGYHGIGHLAVCPGFDKQAFTTFRDAYRGHGPGGCTTGSGSGREPDRRAIHYAATKRLAETNGGYEPALAAATKNLGDRVEITIRDNGTGVLLDVKEKMFNPFFTTKPAGEGTGLGLSISYDIIVKQHGGSIEVETQARRVHRN